MNNRVYWAPYRYKTRTFYMAMTMRGLFDITLAAESQEEFLNHLQRRLPVALITRDLNALDQVFQQFDEYFYHSRHAFDISLDMQGTPFQMGVWTALQNIPYGQTRSYQEIAEAVQNPKAVRAVGMANHQNPLSIVVPCHRVIGKQGHLTGYGGGLDLKQELLALEGVLLL